MNGLITIKLEGASFNETERCRSVIHTLFEQGVFNMRRGDVILSFDELGNLGSIKLDFVKWRRDKVLPVVRELYKVVIEPEVLAKKVVV